MSMERYAAENAAMRIDGYFNPWVARNGPIIKEFERAKEECLGHMRTALEQTASMTWEEFAAARCTRIKDDTP